MPFERQQEHQHSVDSDDHQSQRVAEDSNVAHNGEGHGLLPDASYEVLQPPGPTALAAMVVSMLQSQPVSLHGQPDSNDCQPSPDTSDGHEVSSVNVADAT